MAESHKIPCAGWVSVCVWCLIGVILHSIILQSEIKKRKQASNKFTTKSLQLTSIICIISGLITNICWVLYPLPGFCHFTGLGTVIALCTQGVSMGLYQLSRLYYSFANDKIHSKKGYSRCLFIFMTTFGIFCLINFPIGVLLTGYHDSTVLASKCGINDKFELYYENIHTIYIKNGFLWPSISALSFFIWDVATVLLYANKIRMFRSFKETQPEVYQRILCILYKIFILSMFYEISSFISLFGNTLHSMLDDNPYIDWIDLFINIDIVLITISTSFSMYLMMEYNEKEYNQFLRFIHKTKLYFCCCCCKYMVIDQLNIDSKTLSDEVSKNNVKNIVIKETRETSFETAVKSVNDQRIDTNGCELSVETPP